MNCLLFLFIKLLSCKIPISGSSMKLTCALDISYLLSNDFIAFIDFSLPLATFDLVRNLHDLIGVNGIATSNFGKYLIFTLL